MKLKYLGFLALLALSLPTLVVPVFAADANPSPSPLASLVAAPASVAVVSAPADPASSADFLKQVLDLVQQFGGLSWAARVAAMILLLIASTKVSFLSPYWAKLGEARVLVAPFFGLVAGVVSLHPFSWAGLFAYLGAGAGAVLLHELLDAMKSFPGVGPMYVTLISFFEGMLGGGDGPKPVAR